MVRSGNAHSSVGGSDSSIYNDILTSADCDWGCKEYVTWRSLINIKFTLIMKKNVCCVFVYSSFVSASCKGCVMIFEMYSDL